MAKCTESDSLLLANSEGKAIRFCADDSQVTELSPAVHGSLSLALHLPALCTFGYCNSLCKYQI